MKNINRRMKRDNLYAMVLNDKHSYKGFITDASMVITVMVDPVNKNLGVAVKKRGDINVPRIGKTIAYRNLKAHPIAFTDEDSNALLKKIFFADNEVIKSLDKKTKFDFYNLVAYIQTLTSNSN